MKIHHLDCGTMCPLARRLINGDGGLFERGHMVCHCFVIEAPNGLVLVDTGLGTQDIAQGLDKAFTLITKPVLSPKGTALAQIQALGFKAEDVRDIVVTHLDLDHAGGLPDFPHARVHLHAAELRAAQSPATVAERRRYLPRQWAHDPNWQAYDGGDGEPWFGFEAVRDLKGLPPEILLVPLFGHTRGHTGVAIKGDDGWLLHGGDAYFHRHDLLPNQKTPIGLRLFQRAVAVDNRTRLKNLVRLQRFAANHGHEVRITSAHDPIEFEACRAH